MNGWVSPRLGIRFDTSGAELRIFAPDGTPFRSHEEVVKWAMQAEQERETERTARQQAEQERDQERQRTAQLEARLREIGVEPETIENGEAEE
jgi:hypothetical protein